MFLSTPTKSALLPDYKLYGGYGRDCVSEGDSKLITQIKTILISWAKKYQNIDGIIWGLHPDGILNVREHDLDIMNIIISCGTDPGLILWL